MTLSRRVVAEVLGTAFLLAAVVGSGIMGKKPGGRQYRHSFAC
jgi:glycerol uptake facilitator-like aquaporin